MNIKLRKRMAIITGVTIISTSMLIGCNKTEEVSSKAASVESVVGKDLSADEAKNLLIEGNKRFTEEKIGVKDLSPERVKDLAENGQHPFTVVLTCGDSRVAPEELFDRGLGDIFTVRNAGNVVDTVTLGSIEYGAEHLGTPLVVVLGHSQCGAVDATIKAEATSPNIAEIAKHITPALDRAKAANSDTSKHNELTEDENIIESINAIKSSDVMKHLIDEGKVQVVGAKYDVKTGKVEFR